MPRDRQRLTMHDFARFGEAVAAIALASAAVRFLPFRWVVRSMGSGDTQPAKRRSTPQVIVRSIKRASRRVPWRTVCIQEGLAVHWLLRRRGYPSRLHYGIRPDAAALKAHVWITLEEEVVIGETEADPHLPVASFPQAGAGRRSEPDYSQ